MTQIKVKLILAGILVLPLKRLAGKNKAGWLIGIKSFNPEKLKRLSLTRE